MHTGPREITAGTDGALWFTYENEDVYGPGMIGRMTTSGAWTQYLLSDEASQTEGIASAPDGALWFTELYSGLMGRITTNGTYRVSGIELRVVRGDHSWAGRRALVRGFG